MPGRRRRTAASTPPGWDRGRLLAVLASATLAVVLLVAGLALAAYYTMHPSGQAQTAGGYDRRPAGARGEPAADTRAAHRDALARAPMTPVTLADAQPGVLSARDPGVIVLPAPTRTGPAGVPTGYPQTPEGALAQLAAIDKAALESGSVDGARTVIAGWAAPGGPTTLTWSGVRAMAGFLSAAGLSGGRSPGLGLAVTAMMGQVKATDGPGFVIGCVDFEVDATLAQTARVGVADCQRMVWQGARWVVGPGPEPAPAPSVWPGTDVAIAAGYKNLRHG